MVKRKMARLGQRCTEAPTNHPLKQPLGGEVHEENNCEAIYLCCCNFIHDRRCPC